MRLRFDNAQDYSVSRTVSKLRMKNNLDRGIVYIATGEDFVNEACISAKSVRKFMPKVSITLFTNGDVDQDIFDNIVNIDNPRHDFGDQVYHLSRTPYKRTIFLDTDVYLDASITDIFDLLSEFDIAAAQGLRNYSSKRLNLKPIEQIPDCFPEYNSGVVAFEMNPTVKKFFENWEDAYAAVLDQGQIHNQAAFRLALYQSDVRLATLPDEYNCLFRHPGRVYGTVKAFHGRLIDIETPGASQSVAIEQAVREINSRTDLRLHHRIGDEVKLVNQSLFERILYSISTRGFLGTARRFPKFLHRKLSF